MITDIKKTATLESNDNLEELRKQSIHISC